MALPRANIGGTDGAEIARGIDERNGSERNEGWVRLKGNIFDGRTNKQPNTVGEHAEFTEHRDKPIGSESLP